MTVLGKHIYRIAVDFGKVGDSWIDYETEEVFYFSSGVDLQIQIAIRENKPPETESFYDLSNVASMKLEIKERKNGRFAPDADAPAYMLQEVTTLDSVTVDLNDWQTGVSQHATFDYTAAQTALPVDTYFMIISGVLNDGSIVTFGSAQMKVVQDGTGPETTVAPQLPAEYDAATVDALLAQKQSITPENISEENKLRATYREINKTNITNLNAENELIFFKANPTNTAALSGLSPYYSTDANDVSGNGLWLWRSGFGFDANGNSGVFEKRGIDGGGIIGAQGETLVTTITGLTPGQNYKIFACHLTDQDGNWTINAGLTSDDLKNASRLGAINIGISSVPSSNRLQLINPVGFKVADLNGEIDVFVTNRLGDERAFYDGLAYAPVNYPNSKDYSELGDGVWSWFSSGSTLRLRDGAVILGCVSSDGKASVIRRDISSSTLIELSSWAQIDDHGVPSFTMLPDGRIFAAYARHNDTSGWQYRVSLNDSPKSINDWSPEGLISDAGSLSYNNAFYLPSYNKIYQFSRQVSFNPTLYIVDPLDFSFTKHELIRSGNGATRPYARYFSNNKDRVDLIYTQGHPRDLTTSVWHGYVDSSGFYQTDGTLIKNFVDFPVLHDSAETGTQIYQYNASAWTTEGVDDWIPSARAWVNDLVRYADGTIRAAYSVMTREANYLSRRCYYYISTWDGSSWTRKMVAQGGHALYAAEKDYPGCIALDPINKDVAYFSSNHADPSDLSILNTEIGQNFELYKINGAEITPLTIFSKQASLRPVIAPAFGGRMIFFFEGEYQSYTAFKTTVKNVFDII